MRILFLQFPLEPAFGGAEVQTLALARGFAKYDNEVLLVSSNPELISSFRKSGFVAEAAFVGFEPTSVRALFLFPFTFFIALVRFIIAFFTFRPEAIFCLSLTDKLLATVVATFFSARVIWIEHTRIGKWLTANPLKFWYKAMASTVRITAPSYFLRNQLIALGVHPNRISVIYPGISFSFTREKDPSWTKSLEIRDSAEKKFTLGFLGRLASEKGIDVLMRSIKELQGANLRIAGTGPNENELKKLAADLAISNQVEFLGFVSDKRNFFESIDALIVPSIKAESFGLVIIEAMAAGVPVIASRIGAIPEIIEHKKTGLLFEPGNVNELTRIIKLFAVDAKLHTDLINKARDSVQSRFNFDQMISSHLALLKR